MFKLPLWCCTLTSGKQYAHLKEAKGPGDVISVDQLVSSVPPGFIAQEKTNVPYKLTRQRFKAATIFVDHFSCLSYVQGGIPVYQLPHWYLSH